MGLSLVGAQHAFGTSSGFRRWTCTEEGPAETSEVMVGLHTALITSHYSITLLTTCWMRAWFVAFMQEPSG